LSEFVVLQYPGLFWLWYLLVIPLLFVVKFQYYRRMQWHYFLIDFCYFTNLSVLMEILLFPAHSKLSKINFLFSNGPLAMAIPLWRNSVVFHDMDRISSLYIHIFPVLVSFCLHWYPSEQIPKLLYPLYHPTNPVMEDSGISMGDFLAAVGGYALWQFLYLMKTDIMDRETFEMDPGLQTSLTWLASDSSNPMHKLVVSLSRKWGIYGPKEKPDASTVKTKIVFVTSQLIYTAAAFLLGVLVHRSFYLHVALIWWLFIVAVHNGASYYIEVFSRKYMAKFKDNEFGHASGHDFDEERRSKKGK